MSRFARASVLSIFVCVLMPLTVSAQIGSFGWVSADRPSFVGQYDASPALSRNSSGGVNTIERLSEGVYLVLLPKLGATPGGNVQVVAYGTSAARCHVMWQTEIDKVKRVIVGCTDAIGDFVDTTFTLSFINHAPRSPWETGRAYALVSHPSPGMVWDEDEVSEYRFNSESDEIGFAYVSEGRYLMRFYGQESTTPTYRVTPYGLFSTTRCKVGSTTTQGLFTVACFDATGAPEDTSFFAAYESTRVNSGTTSAHFRVNATGTQALDAYNGGSLGTNTISVGRYSTGLYIARVLNIASTTSFGTVYASALSSSSNGYCKPWGWATGNPSVNDVSIGIQCFDQAGQPTDSAFTVTYQR